MLVRGEINFSLRPFEWVVVTGIWYADTRPSSEQQQKFTL